MARILIADNHPIVRAGAKAILSRDIKDVVWGEAESSQQTLAHVQQGQWDLLILDVSMPGRSGLSLLQDIKGWQPKLPVLVFSIYAEQLYGKRALQAGASGYLTKDSATDELLKAARKLLDGGRYVSPSLAEWLATDLGGHAEGPPHEILSDRELEVLRMVGEGKTVSRIASSLNLSVTTVSTYRARILEKMGMTTTAEMMRYALTNNLVSDST